MSIANEPVESKDPAFLKPGIGVSGNSRDAQADS
jgi:hypothetical protein